MALDAQLLTFINIVCSFLALIPFVLILVYKSIVWQASRIQFWYLAVVLCVELSAYVSSVYFHYTLLYSGVMYTLFEVLLIAFLLTRWLKRAEIMYVIIALCYTSFWITDMAYSRVPHYSLIFGLENITLIIFTVYFLISHLSDGYPKWQVSFVIGLLLYSVLSSAIFAFMDFFITNANTQYIHYYTIIHAFANLCLYFFITLSILQCKKQLSSAS